MTETAWYVYAVLPEAVAAAALAALPEPTPAILPDTEVTVIAASGLAAWVSAVPRGPFVADHMASRAADPDWVAARAAAHHQVVTHAATLGQCVPLGFGTLFSSPGAVRAWLTASSGGLCRALAGLGGKWEWAVRLGCDEAARSDWLRANDPGLLALAEAAASAGPGAAFLMRRRLEKAEASVRAAQTKSVQGGLSDDFHAMNWLVRDEPAAGAQAGWAILAPEADDVAGRMAASAAVLAGSGFLLRVTGPWPPYAFARDAWQVQANG
jgi:hypothetical protein